MSRGGAFQIWYRLFIQKERKMYSVTILAEVSNPLRPEEMNTLESMEMKIELLTALQLHGNYGYVKIINVEVHPSYDATTDNISHSPKTL